MGRENLNRLITRDPVSGGDLVVSELSSLDGSITVRGRFAIPRYARLDVEEERFLETFLRCRGMMNQVEQELGISYPTVRGRLDALLAALDLTPVKERTAKKSLRDDRRAILDKLEKGEITADEAKEKLREVRP